MVNEKHREHRLLRGVLGFIWFVVVLLGVNLVPSFVVHYEQRIASALDQAILDNIQFREIVDQIYNGDIEAYIQHHLDSEDPTFHTEGEILRRNFANEIALRREHELLRSGGLLSDVQHIIWNGNRDVIVAAWEIYEPSFVYSEKALFFTLFGGLFVWLIPFTLWWAARKAMGIFRRARIAESPSAE